MERTKWVERTFNLGVPPGWLPNILARLDGAYYRLEHLTKSLTEDQLKVQKKGGWSIKEHVGHLIDLEALHSGRIDDFIQRKKTLRAADMSNKHTYAANHNETPTGKLLEDFRTHRTHFIERLRNLDKDTQVFVAQHPRLNVPMRIVDIAFFTAEHDDHHIATIYELIAERSG